MAMRDDPNVMLKCQILPSPRTHKRCWSIRTAGRWPWKSETAKDRVTTHLPNGLALKMDGAKGKNLYITSLNKFCVRLSRRARRLLCSSWREPE